MGLMPYYLQVYNVLDSNNYIFIESESVLLPPSHTYSCIDDHLGISRDVLFSGLIACLYQLLFLDPLPFSSVLRSYLDLQQHQRQQSKADTSKQNVCPSVSHHCCDSIYHRHQYSCQ